MEENIRKISDIDYREGNYVIIDGKKLLNMSSNDYLSISTDRDLLNEFLDRLHGEEKQKLFDSLKEHYMLNEYTATEKDVLAVYREFKELYEQKRLKRDEEE